MTIRIKGVASSRDEQIRDYVLAMIAELAEMARAAKDDRLANSLSALVRSPEQTSPFSRSFKPNGLEQPHL